jgi:single-strand DNA-binding protein
MQKVILIGNIGNDCTVKDINGKKAINFSIAHTDKFKDSSGVQTERTTWWDCGIWKKEGQSTELAKYLQKGTKVYIEGSPTFEMYNDKQGKPKIACRVNVLSLELLSAQKKEDGAQKNETNQSEQGGSPGVNINDDLPF